MNSCTETYPHHTHQVGRMSEEGPEWETCPGITAHYEMSCKNCDEQTEAYATRNFEYVCMVCGWVAADAEQGHVFDIDEAAYHLAEYRGMKQAGMFKSKWEQEEEASFDD